MNILFLIFAILDLVSFIASVVYTGLSALSLFLALVAIAVIAAFILKKNDGIKKLLFIAICVLSAFSVIALLTIADSFIINP